MKKRSTLTLSHHLPGFDVSAADLSKLTAIISTADHSSALQRLVRSLRRAYPDLQILVADASSESARLPRGIESIRLPARSGRSAGYNALLARVRTPYILLLDDCCELSKEPRIEQLLALVAQDKVDVAAGDLIACQRKLWLLVSRRPAPGHGLMEFAGDQLTLARGARGPGEGFYWCDLVSPFFVARTNKVRALGGWDQQLENDGQEEFFVRAHRQGLRVGIAPAVTAWLWNEKPAVDPARDLKSLAVAKMGLASMTDFDGRVMKAPRRAMAA